MIKKKILYWHSHQQYNVCPLSVCISSSYVPPCMCSFRMYVPLCVYPIHVYILHVSFICMISYVYSRVYYFWAHKNIACNLFVVVKITPQISNKNHQTDQQEQKRSTEQQEKERITELENRQDHKREPTVRKTYHATAYLPPCYSRLAGCGNTSEG